MELASLIISILTAVAVVVGAIFTYFHTKHQIITSTITGRRQDWINAMREMLARFLREYITSDNKTELRVIKAEIEIHMSSKSSYREDLTKHLEKCIMEKFNDDDCKLLIHISRCLLTRSYWRMKIEAGLYRKNENKTARKLNAELETEYLMFFEKKE